MGRAGELKGQSDLRCPNLLKAMLKAREHRDTVSMTLQLVFWKDPRSCNMTAVMSVELGRGWKGVGKRF